MQKYIQCVHTRNINASPKETIYAIKNAGFDGAFIQWNNKPLKFSQKKQLKLCRKIGLEVSFVHLGYDEINNIWLDGKTGDKLVKSYIKDLNVCKKNNIDTVILHLTRTKNVPKLNMLGISRLQKIIDHAEKIGINITFENVEILGSLEYIFNNIKNKNIGVCFDIGHYHYFFDDNFNWNYFKNKIWLIHLHDNDKSADLHLLPFDGTAPFDLITTKLKESNYKGPVILESLYSEHYSNMSIEEFYKLSFERAKQIKL